MPSVAIAQLLSLAREMQVSIIAIDRDTREGCVSKQLHEIRDQLQNNSFTVYISSLQIVSCFIPKLLESQKCHPSIHYDRQGPPRPKHILPVEAEPSD